MRQSVKTPFAKPGDVIGVYSPSSGIESGLEVNYERGKKLLLDRGYSIREAQHMWEWKAHYASDAPDTATDFIELLRDPEVKAILPTLGGTTAYQLLPLLPYEEIQRHPKMIFGFSDNSLQACVIHDRTGLVTFHGHSDVLFGLGDLGDEEKMKEFSQGGRYTLQQFFDTLEGRMQTGPVQKASAWRALRPGSAGGRLICGNLDVLQILNGTPYAPDWSGTIFCWEAAGVELHRVDLMLASLALTGVLSQISGMVVGKATNLEEEFFALKHETLDEMILRHCRPYDFPIIVDADIGHDMECCMLPLGIRAQLDGDNLILLDSPYE